MIVWRPCGLGDFILTLPALARIAANGSPVLLVSHRPCARLAIDDGLVDTFLDTDAFGLHSLFASHMNARLVRENLPDLVQRLARGDDAVLFLRPAPAVDILADNLRLLGARNVRIIDPLPPPGVHSADHLLRPFVDGPDGFAIPSLSAPRRASPGSVIKKPGEARPLAVIHPGAGNEAKRWPVDRWSAMAERLAPTCQCLLVSGPADAAAAADLARRTGLPVASDLELPALAALLAHCDLFLGHDSGVSHLAAAVGAPVIALFGPTNPAQWAPRGEKVMVLSAGPPGTAMDKIDVETVWDAAQKILANR
jgi:heptosyltransferase III